MTADQRIPAAQYLRMSTEHQQYSIDNQALSIEQYAKARGFAITRTYSDPAKSGLRLRNRRGLCELLQDVAAGKTEYKAVLVYDVSRWGRFQDTDEAAHYEFLCKSAGIPVHYCAETFTNDGSLPSAIMKALKRVMAGEYSRELGSKVLSGQRRLARLGFKQGGLPGYGLRRSLVSADRQPKQSLAFGERKSLATDRVVLVPGPAHEVHVVREIYRMVISDGLPIHAIAQKLNSMGVEYRGDSPWTHHTVNEVLTNPKYAGFHVYGRTSSRLYTAKIRLPKSEWLLTSGAFEPLVDFATFMAAQRILNTRTIKKTDMELLDDLKALLARESRLSLSLIKNSEQVASPSTYRDRFGSLRKAYELIGYGAPDDFGSVDLRRRTQEFRRRLIAQLAESFPNEITVIRPGGRWRERLKLRGRFIVSVVVARSVRTWGKTIAWVIDPVRNERRHVTLLARLDLENRSLLDLHLLPNIERPKRFFIRLRDQWLSRGERLSRLDEFCSAATRALETRQSKKQRS